VYAVTLDVEGKDGKYVTEEDLLIKGKQKVMGDLKKNGEIKSPIICIGDGISDMKIKTSGVADFSIGFGVNNFLQQTKDMSDYYAHDMQEFSEILFKLLYSSFQ
jgi:soluble P-type ATPase